MKKLLLMLAAMSSCTVLAMAQDSPVIDLTAGGVSSDIQLTSVGTGTVNINGLSYVGSEWTGSATVGGLQFSFNGVDPTTSGQLGVLYNSDPFLFYSYSVTNTLTTSINVNANIPVTPVTLTPGSYTLSSSLGYSLTDANPNVSSVWVAPQSSPGYVQQNLVDGVDVGVDLGTTTFSNNRFGFTATTTYYGGPSPYSTATSASTIGVNTTFTLSGGSSLGITGFFDIEPVSSAPEPSGLGLAILAFGAFAFLMFRTRRAR